MGSQADSSATGKSRISSLIRDFRQAPPLSRQDRQRLQAAKNGTSTGVGAHSREHKKLSLRAGTELGLAHSAQQSKQEARQREMQHQTADIHCYTSAFKHVLTGRHEHAAAEQIEPLQAVQNRLAYQVQAYTGKCLEVQDGPESLVAVKTLSIPANHQTLCM